MSRKDTRTPEQQELDERERYAQEHEARLDETLTRREVLEALDYVRDQYSPHHDSHMRDFLQRLTNALS